MQPDLMALAAPLIGAPYRDRGRSPEGWDCWGLVHWCREHWLGKPTPSYADLYSEIDFRTSERRAVKTMRMIMAEIAQWSPVERRAGAVVLLTRYERPIHVGLMLDHRNFLHADTTGTSIGDLEWPPARLSYKFAGCWDA
jgi:cell wall-associated NlpC family hydrolase